LIQGAVQGVFFSDHFQKMNPVLRSDATGRVDRMWIVTADIPASACAAWLASEKGPKGYVFVSFGIH
jgi:hypothetical protein